jgi:hypothetical protein
MLISSVHCKIHCTSDLLEIVSILEQIPYNIQSTVGILIGSRAARYYLRNFRDTLNDGNADLDIITSPNFLLKWLNDNHEFITTIDAIVPTTNDNELLDLYLNCILSNKPLNYDFVVPRSSASYTAYLLDNQDRWIDKDFYRELWWQRERASIRCGSIKLLLILKKYMLYYSHQWEKTAKDYRELLSVTDPLTDDDTILCNLFVCYNEKIHGKRSSDTDEFIIHSTNMQKSLTIKRDDFFQYEKRKKYHVYIN